MKKLGFGCMRLPLLNPEDNTSVDFDQVCSMVDLFLERGFTYFDTAYFYHGGTSEDTMRRALVERHPRDSFTLATKLPLTSLKEATDPKKQEEIFQLQLRRCGVDYFDYYLLHNVNQENYQTAQRLDSFSFALAMKEAGKIRHLGFSFHDGPELLEQVLTEHPQVEFVQLQLNYLDWEDPGVQARRCYEVAVAHGKSVVVMEPVKGGKLANPPQEVAQLFRSYDPAPSLPSWAIRFAASQEHVFMVLSGMSSLEQVEDNTSYMADFHPLTPQELALTTQAADLIRGDGTVPCTGCAYCVDGCPQHISIPTLFTIYNGNIREPEAKNWAEEYKAQAVPASACVRCGQCMGACPQHIDVIGSLIATAATFEK